MTSRRMFFSAAGGLIALLIGLTAAPVASASQKPATASLSAKALARYKFNKSSIAWAGSRAVVAATDAHGDLYYFWLASGRWHSQEVAKGKRGVLYSKAAIAWTGNATVIAAVNSAGALVYWRLPQGSTKWHYQQVAKVAHHSFQNPSITGIPGGGVLISTANSAGELLSFSRAGSGGSWAETVVGYGTFGPSSVITCFDSLAGRYLALITATSGGTLYLWWEFVTSPGWSKETIASPGPSGSFSSGGSIAATANHILVTAATTTGIVDFWSQSIGGTGWAQETIAGGGSNRYSHAGIAWTGASSGYDVVTATNQHGQLDYWWTSDGFNLWTHEKIAGYGKNYVYANPGIAISATAVIVTAVNTKPGDVWYWHQPFNTNPWLKQRVAQG
jgi:hypothetical protein